MEIRFKEQKYFKGSEEKTLVKKKVAIIGLGIAGLHAAYALRNEDLCEVTVFNNKTAEEVRTGRIPSTQTHFQQILNSEKLFRIPDYGPVHEIHKMELRFNDSLSIKGRLKERAVTIDQRIYLAALIDNLKAMKIQHENKRIHSADLPRLASEFDLIVDCTGKIGPIGDFKNYCELEMPEKPLRVCSAGFFHGITPDEENKMCIHVVPGQGELFEVSTYTGHGAVRTFLLEAVPGSELDCIKTNDPTLFSKSM